ncbi:MAG: CTP--2,3-di-O-geranylgeranyl-sn-glycero-1-phosphate cytidyltransferase [Nanoarchaeota archaeon]
MVWSWRHELARKAVHLSSILILVIYISIGRYSDKLALLFLAFLLVVLLELEYFRIDFWMRLRFFQKFQQFRRKKEAEHLGGEVFFLMGAILVLAIFDFRIASAAILMTTFGDLIASLVGRAIGRHRIWRLKKSWEGAAAEFAMNLLIGFLIVRNTIDNGVWFLIGTGPQGTPIWPIILVMAFTATATEVLTNKLDDNLLIPLFSGFNGQLVLLLLSVAAFPM